MTKRTFCTLLMSAGLVGSIIAGSATAVLAADKAIKIGACCRCPGPAPISARRTSRCRARARTAQQGRSQWIQIRGSVRGFGVQPAAGDASGQTAHRPVQARCRDRRRMLGRDACRHAADGAGQGSASQCRLLRDQDHRARQSLDVPHHAERSDAGRRYRDQCVQPPQCAHGGAAAREHQCRHRQC